MRPARAFLLFLLRWRKGAAFLWRVVTTGLTPSNPRRSLQKRAPTDPDFVHKTNKAWTLNLEMCVRLAAALPSRFVFCSLAGALR